MSIPQFIENILAKFHLSDAHPVCLPVVKGAPRLSRESSPSSPADIDAMANIPFHQAVGCLMYTALTVRVDIAFMASQLTQHCKNKGMEHWKAETRVLRYLSGTRNHSLCFGGKGFIRHVIVGYIHARHGLGIDFTGILHHSILANPVRQTHPLVSTPGMWTKRKLAGHVPFHTKVNFPGATFQRGPLIPGRHRHSQSAIAATADSTNLLTRSWIAIIYIIVTKGLSTTICRYNSFSLVNS
jgi:hypothetical protein